MSYQTAAKKNKEKCGFLYYFVKVTAAIPAVLWFRPKVYYAGKRPKFKNAMLCANHKSMEDPLVVQMVFWYRTMYFLATKDLYRTKLLNFFFSRIHCIPVDKTNFSMDSFHAVCDRLEKGYPVMIFPEGGLNHSQEAVSALKSGVVIMAHKTRSPILPMYLVPAEKWYQRRVLVIGELLDPRQLCGDRPSMLALQDVTQELHRRELALRDYYENIQKEK